MTLRGIVLELLSCIRCQSVEKSCCGVNCRSTHRTRSLSNDLVKQFAEHVVPLHNSVSAAGAASPNRNASLHMTVELDLHLLGRYLRGSQVAMLDLTS